MMSALFHLFFAQQKSLRYG